MCQLSLAALAGQGFGDLPWDFPGGKLLSWVHKQHNIIMQSSLTRHTLIGYYQYMARISPVIRVQRAIIILLYIIAVPYHIECSVERSSHLPTTTMVIDAN